MGGNWYDREVSSVAPDHANQVFSATAAQAFKLKSLHPDLNPFQRPIHCTTRSPVVICVDVTGSMGKWPRVIWDKLPMFFGQIMMKQYLDDPSFSFCAIGDAYGDSSPLQVTNFAQGTPLDDQITKIHIEGGGVGLQGDHESYELAAYYYANLCYFDVEPVQKPIMFITGDEAYYDSMNGEQVGQLMTGEKLENSSSLDCWQVLKEKFQVYHLHKTLDYGGPDDEAVVAKWKRALGDSNVIRVNNPKACVDVMLGVIALLSGKRNLQTYLNDMRERGQSDARITEVSNALSIIHIN